VLNFSISWLMSTIVASGQMLNVTAFIPATYGSRKPKSVVNVMIGLAIVYFISARS